ncbi:Na+/H+ antiporter NhaA [Sinomonas notoginsengisoli]|uniref:Na+/H+ antiporter NhaA n=1 Tax=Sinomonas notoginsengisoli TaxID=1457311 RepID=UPI001F341E6E|nr:Na+/H+ antiporter NhaA [Sinomonas notoginsengisoli]
MNKRPARRRPPTPTLKRGSYPEYRRIAEILRKETVGGALLLIATIAALVWANSPARNAYAALRDTPLGYSPWNLDLSIGDWAADGLLALFFFVAGLELKREFVAGDLRRPSTALVPIVAAFGGVAVPALIYTSVGLATGSDGLRGWAIPTATDIAFALAVLAVISTHLPAALRTFLLTLAVVDDLIAIAIIAFVYSSHLEPVYLVLALLPLAGFGVLVQLRIRAWYLLVPLALVTWALVHASGVHATVSGVLLAFSVPVLRSAKNGGPDAGPGLAEHFEHRLRPLSAGFAVPVFAFFSAGVALGGWDGVASALRDPVAVGVAAALVIGKAVGVFASTWLVTASRHADLDPALAWVDVAGLALLAGVGFTVSLLIAELSFGPSSAHGEHAKAAILAGSLTAALLAAVVLRLRNRHYRRVEAEEGVDADGDGVPDAFQRGDRE